MNRQQRRRLERLKRKKEKGSAAATPQALDNSLRQAMSHHQAGRLEQAVQLYRQVLDAVPSHPEANHLMGLAAYQGGDLETAVELIAKAAAKDPGQAHYHSNLGVALKDLGRLDEAAECYRKALRVMPDYAEAHNNLGIVMMESGRPQDAEACYKKALDCQPGYMDAHINLGNALKDQGRFDEAAASYQTALRIQPDHMGAHNNLGTYLKEQGRHGDAASAFRRAVEISPDFADALSNLGLTVLEQGEAEVSLSHFERALEGQPERPDIHSNLLMALNSIEGREGAGIHAEHRRWGERFAPPRKNHPNPPNPERALKIGYVSPDFRRHSVAYFIEPVLAAHDQAGMEVFCYANLAREDNVTERLRGLAGHWRDIRRSGDEAAARRILDDGIDILVDLAGHTTSNRLGVFALKPAPVQVAWIGYPNTTGLEAMDYRLTDRTADPEGESTDALYSERLVRLDGGFLCYRPPDQAPQPATSRSGPPTFGSCNNLSKVGPGVVALWAAVLKRVEGSKLLLKSRALGDKATRDMVAERFAEQGIGAGRLEMVGWVTSGSHLDIYGAIDVCLDTFPYNGTTTTCEALWMGVPVVSLEGDRHAGRVGASLLSRIGLEDLIAKDADGYVELAASLAADKTRLEELRSGLRGMIGDSGLTDGPAFTAGLEAAYRGMWRQWCAPQKE